MRELSETATTLTVHDPLWFGLVGLAACYALSWWLLKTAGKSKKPVQQTIAGIGGVIIGTLIGYGALVDRVTLDGEGVRENHLFSQYSAAWKDVTEVSVADRRTGRRGMQPHLVLEMARGEMAVEISGLSPAEIERVLAFARKRAAAR